MYHTNSLIHALILSHSLSLSHSFTLSFTHSLIHLFSLSLSLSLSLSSPETGQSGPMYQDPNTIERQQAPTGDFYAVPDRNKKSTVRRDPPAAPTELATYQDPSTIQHETAPTGDLYAIADKKPPAPKPVCI